ncbi:hypothetical protein CEXT_688671 [Caerostris extrusa]|uniref:Major facilitator superfamily (MFS) profile domain-containing protein n=1 Tax=Caerostris extrusa TaxID=172846 RepID=A0AAV4S648_CAEEX|nr:hypothetical protein CEXT_688671 [Caerostris extrusa]
MVFDSSVQQSTSTLDYDDTCDVPQGVNVTTPEEEGDYIWQPSMQGIILSAYFYGYVCTQVVGGRVAEIVRGKWVMGFSILIASLLTLVTPIAADISVVVCHCPSCSDGNDSCKNKIYQSLLNGF